MNPLDAVPGGLHLRSGRRVLQPRWWLGMVDRETRMLASALLSRLSGPLDTLVPAVLDEVLRHAQLTDLVLRYVDVDRVAAAVDLDAAAARIDISAIVARIDLITLAEQVIDGVDLPEIIRESTGSMASDTVRSIRMQGIVADEAVGRTVDRMLTRRRGGSASHGADHERDEPEHPTIF